MSEGLTLAVWTALLLQPQLGWLVERHPYPSLPVPQAKSLVVPGLRLQPSALNSVSKKMKLSSSQGPGKSESGLSSLNTSGSAFYDSEQQDMIKP